MLFRSIALPDKQIGAVENTPPTAMDASPLGKPAKASKAIQIPETPFVLDPLL